MAKSNRTGFYSTFPTLGQTSFDVESWEPFFANFDEEFWSEEGSGVVGFRTEEQLEYSAIVTPASTEGFVIVLACDDLQTNRKRWSKVAVEDPEQLADFQEIADEIFYPAGCVLTPKSAWSVMRSFLIDPTQAGNLPNLVDENELEWPED